MPKTFVTFVKSQPSAATRQLQAGMTAIQQSKKMQESNNVEIIKVETKAQLKAFINFYYDLYRSCAYAVPYLYSDEKNTLRKDRNPAFAFCEADYFLAIRDGRVVGRVAAMINNRANEHWGRKTVRFGWFDFVNDAAVAKALLDTVEQWGRNRGMTEMSGPFGFEDMDREGMLVEGFDQIATMYVNYNYDYYPRLMEQMGGFRKDNDYVEYKVKVPEVTPPKFARTAALIEKRYGLAVRKFNYRDMKQGGRGRELFAILNATYKDLYGYSQLSIDQIDRLVDEYIKMADLNLVACVVDTTKNDKMVGFGVSFPSFSEALRKTRDGRLLPFGWWPLLRVLKWHKTPVVDLLLIGVLPEYRIKGANALIFNDLIGWYRRYGFSYAQTGPQMETNKGVLSQWQYLDATCNRRHRIYVKEIGAKQ